MKKLLVISAILFSSAFYKAESQIHVNINIGSQPIWGPVGYDYAQYYYLPDLDVYYDVPRQQFVYFDLGRWIFASSLPSRYGRYDLFNSYKVVVNDRDPWLRHTYYRDHYYRFRGQHQSVIRDSHESKYFVIRDHPEHNRYNERPVQRNGDGRDNRGHGDDKRGHDNKDHHDNRDHDKDHKEHGNGEHGHN